MSRPSSPSPGTRKRILKVDVHDGRCSLSNADIQHAVVPAYLIDPETKRTDTDLVDSLEWSWGLRKNSLNLHTRYNFFNLRKDHERQFANACWMLLPESATIERLHQRVATVSRAEVEFDDLSKAKQSWEYRIIALPGMMYRTPVYYHIWDDQLKRPIDVAPHFEPFDTLPPLTLHVPPHFVIFNAGCKLDEHQRRFGNLDSLLKLHPELSMILDIYHSWCRRVPEDVHRDPTYSSAQTFPVHPRPANYWTDGSDYTPSGRFSPIVRPPPAEKSSDEEYWSSSSEESASLTTSTVTDVDHENPLDNAMQGDRPPTGTTWDHMAVTDWISGIQDESR